MIWPIWVRVLGPASRLQRLVEHLQQTSLPVVSATPELVDVGNGRRCYVYHVNLARVRNLPGLKSYIVAMRECTPRYANAVVNSNQVYLDADQAFVYYIDIAGEDPAKEIPGGII